MRLFCRCFIYVLIAYLFTACSLMSDDLNQVERLIENAPDSALQILKHMPYAQLSDNDKAFFGLLYIKTLDKNHLSLEPDSLLQFSISYYELHADADHLSECYFYKARMLRYNFAYEKSMDFYLKALDLSNSLKDDAFLLGNINLDMGIIHNTQRDFDLARDKFQKAHRLFSNTHAINLSNFALIYIGRTYLEQKQYNKAINYYQLLLIHTSDSLQLGVLNQEIGIGYYQSGKLDSALLLLRKSLTYPFVGYEKAFRLQTMADVFYDMDIVDSSELYANKALKMSTDVRICKNCYRVLSNCASTKKNMPALKVYMNHYQNCADSVKAIDVQTKGSYLESMHNTKVEVVRSKTKVLILSIFLFIVIVCSVFAYVLKHRKSSLDKVLAIENQHQQKIALRLEVLERTREALLKRIDEKRKEPSTSKSKNGADDIQQKINAIYAELIHFDNPEFFYQQMDAILNNLATNLATNYPTLNQKDIQWACLSLLKIPNTDILYLLDYNAEGFKKMKQRFAKKVNVALVSKIDDFLIALITE